MKRQPNRNLLDFRGRPTQVPRVLTASRILLCILSALCGCAREPGILVNIASWPDGVERIRVRPTLAGSLGTDIYVGREQSRFVVRLPVGSPGTVQLDAVGLDGVDCKLAHGRLMEHVPADSNYFVERTLELSTLSPRECIFDRAARFDVDLGPSSVAVADVNNDQKQDLVVAGYSRSGVYLLLGNGRGSFGMPAKFSLGKDPNGKDQEGPLSIVAGDFNGDLRTDVATANYVSGGVSVLFGNKLGALEPVTAIAIGDATLPSSIVKGDWNGDGKLDLAVANYGGHSFSLLRGDGNRGFLLDSTFCVSGSAPCDVVRPYSLAVADLDGDQRSDLVVTGYVARNVSMFLGNGVGAFGTASPFPVGLNPEGIAVGDFNGDGRPDLVTANSGTNDVTVLLNGKFADARNAAVGAAPISIVVADFNGDQKLDVVVANFGTQAVPGNQISVLLGNGQGGFGPATQFAVAAFPQAVAIGDFNGDGRPDLVVANNGDSSISILLNQF